MRAPALALLAAAAALGAAVLFLYRGQLGQTLSARQQNVTSRRPAENPTPRAPQAAPDKPIAFPESLEGMRFGMSAADVAQRFPPAWEREDREARTLVHYFDESKTKEARFDLAAGGLRGVEIRFQAASKQEVKALYERLRSEAQQQYGSLPGSTETRWTDGKTVARIRREATYVALAFEAAQ